MPYLPNTPDDQQAMLRAIGVGSIDELFAMVPPELRLRGELKLPPAMGEIELTAHMTRLAAKNVAADQSACFLGGGCYDHFIPALVDTIASRGEFYTAYTPYQAEASQGTLQAIFEYQTLVTQLTGMDVSNASLYDGGTAATEAVLMAIGTTRRTGRVVVAGSVHPEYRQTIATYLANLGTELRVVDTTDGVTPVDGLSAAVDSKTACVLVQHPNFFGCLEDVERAAEIAHKAGALLIVAVNPISLGLLKRPGDYGADIVVAEGQPLGNTLSYGGPYLGIMACGEKLVRRMPGRLVGQTTDRRGRRCWVLTLQTREQHIRREKATSNICTNQGLMALRAAVYLATMGPSGMRGVAELCLQKAHYAAERLAALPPKPSRDREGAQKPSRDREGAVQMAFGAPFFNEFVVRLPGGRVEERLDAARRQGILAGVPLGRWYPELADCLLVAVTEKRTKEEIDRLAEVLGTADERR